MLRNKIAKFWLAISILASAAVVSTPSYALPSFARQTNKACVACHFENFPMLTDYGRAFKASGFTEVYSEPTRQNTDQAELNIPLVLNAAFFGTMRVDRYSGADINRQGAPSNANMTEVTLPEEASLFISGRVAANVGFHSEIGLRPSTALAAFKLPFSFPIADTSMRFLAIPFAADGHGPSYGFETLNTGASDIHLTFENANQTSAQAYLGATGTGATGITAVLWDPRFYVSLTKWSPTAGPMGVGSNYSPASGIQAGKAPTANYFRGVYFIPTPGWDTAVGVQLFTGSAQSPFDSTNAAAYPGVISPVTGAYIGPNVDTRMWAVDGQIQGAVGSHLLGVYFTHGQAPASSGSNDNLFNPHAGLAPGYGVRTKSATTLTTSFGLVPSKLNLEAGYMKADNGSDSSVTGFSSNDDAFTLGAAYMFSQNVKFLFETVRLQHSTGGGLDGGFDNSGQPMVGVKQKFTFKVFYDM